MLLKRIIQLGLAPTMYLCLVPGQWTNTFYFLTNKGLIGGYNATKGISFWTWTFFINFFQFKYLFILKYLKNFQLLIILPSCFFFAWNKLYLQVKKCLVICNLTITRIIIICRVSEVKLLISTVQEHRMWWTQSNWDKMPLFR